jgi:hypothetical protein
MSKDAKNEIVLTGEAHKKFEECVAALAAFGFGAEGPAVETTFVEIEDFGHEVGRMIARALEERLASQHAGHYQGEAACPVCHTLCEIRPDPLIRPFQTSDGEMPLHEPLSHCPACRRDFFPSASGIED